jgi:hypothetical protein
MVRASSARLAYQILLASATEASMTTKPTLPAKIPKHRVQTVTLPTYDLAMFRKQAEAMGATAMSAIPGRNGLVTLTLYWPRKTIADLTDATKR